MFDNIVLELAALVGFAAFVSMFVNLGKFVGIVKDDTAGIWVAGLNLIGVFGLYLLKAQFPTVPVENVDSTLLELSKIGTYILSFVTMIFGSKLTYAGLKGLPVIGKSYSG